MTIISSVECQKCISALFHDYEYLVSKCSKHVEASSGKRAQVVFGQYYGVIDVQSFNLNALRLFAAVKGA